MRQSQRVAPIDASDGQPCSWLAANYLLLTCFSNGSVKAICLHRVASMACSRRLFVLIGPEQRLYHSLHRGLGGHPLASQGLTLQVSDADALPDAIATALNREQLQVFWCCPLQALVLGRVAVTKIAHLLSTPAARALF